MFLSSNCKWFIVCIPALSPKVAGMMGWLEPVQLTCVNARCEQKHEDGVRVCDCALNPTWQAENKVKWNALWCSIIRSADSLAPTRTSQIPPLPPLMWARGRWPVCPSVCKQDYNHYQYGNQEQEKNSACTCTLWCGEKQTVWMHQSAWAQISCFICVAVYEKTETWTDTSFFFSSFLFFCLSESLELHAVVFDRLFC